MRTSFSRAAKLASLIGFFAAPACSSGSPAAPISNDGTGADGDPSGSDGSADDGSDSTDGSDGDIGNHADAAVDDSGLPCDVNGLLHTYCVTCHANPPGGGAHVPLLSRDDLLATRGASTLGAQAVERLRATNDERMPPAGPRPGATEIDAFEAWVAQGMPTGTCGTAGDAGVPAEDPAFAGETVCTSDVMWLRGDHESELMHPGMACIDCHTERDEGPRLSIAGTVYSTGHEFDDCNGMDGTSTPVQVIVTDADGNELTLAPNEAGNFLSRRQVRFPITARVAYQGRERAMLQAVDSGDCNSCHTEQGSSNAPGRIAAP